MFLTANIAQQPEDVNDALELAVIEVDVLPVDVVVVIVLDVGIVKLHLLLKPR